MIKALGTSRILNKRKATIALKLAIVFLVFYVLYLQLFVQHNLAELYTQFRNSIQLSNNWIILFAAVILMPLNWYIESKKWNILVNKFQKFSIRDSLRSVLSGLSLAILTPGRIGEYGGRLVGIDTRNHPKAIVANLLSSLSQNIITISFGLFGALFFLSKYLTLESNIYLSLVCISILIISMTTIFYFKVELLGIILNTLPDWKWLRKIKRSIISFSKVDSGTLFTLLQLSGLRYVVFSFQYVLLLLFFGVTYDIVAATLGVMTIFFFQSNLPLPPALSVLARGEIAIFLWSVFTSNVLGILAASFSLWLINLMIPALIGTGIIYKAKLFDS